MKKRVVSSIVMLAIIIPVIILGGIVFDITVCLISVFALKEFLDIKETKKNLPVFMKLMCYIMNVLILFNGITLENNYAIDFRIISGLFFTFLIPVILYHNKELYSINDAFYLIGSIFFLSISFSSIMIIRSLDINILIYLVLITTLTDTYAYLGGSLIGKHKLIPEISPKKTWEGTIIGTLFSVCVATIFYHNIINPDLSLLYVIGISLFLSILGQFGDLVFSSIKRYFDKKDFSNLIPGHGGILDRLDSIIFVSLGFMFICNLI